MDSDGVKSAVRAILAGVMLAATSGCAHNPDAPDPRDPFEQTNRKVYGFNDALDRHVLVPAAQGWQAITPVGFRRGVGNFFGNFYYLNTILNNILQGKLRQAMQDGGRVVLNTTLGIGGFFDVATPFGLPAHQEDFGQTLAVWGVGEGNFLVIPFLGPATERDLPGFGTAAVTNPLFWIGGVITVPIGFLEVINTRADLLEATRLRDEAALDPYTFTREAYRQRRNYLIRDGVGFGEDDLYFDFNDDFDNGADAGTGAAPVPDTAATPAPVAPTPASAPGPVDDGADVLKID